MCGIVGILSQTPVSQDLYDALVHLQHRGQDAAGIITCDQHFHIKKGKGLIREIFHPNDITELTGVMGVAHVRYPTSGKHSDQEIQPFWHGTPYGIALAHNGNLINEDALAEQLLKSRMRHLNTTSDSEVILNLLADSLDTKKTAPTLAAFFEQLCEGISAIHEKVEGSYSIVSTIIGKGMIAFRDPHGIRPLIFGKRTTENQRNDYLFASETTVLYPLGFQLVDNIKAGEVVFITLEGEVFRRTLTQKSFNPCIFEYVYFARPDAVLDDISVYRARLRMGQNLALKWQQTFPDIIPDVVIPVPFTSNTAALAFAKEIGTRYTEGLYKNPFIGRTFIMPNTALRKRSVRYKLIPQETEIRDKKVLLLDDSIVRGTTSKEIIQSVREFGAKEIYFVTTCPPIKFPCFYGIDIPSQTELIGANQSIDAIQTYLNVDKLLYQTIEDLTEAVMRKGNHHIDTPCRACLDGHYVSGKITQERMQHFSEKRERCRE